MAKGKKGIGGPLNKAPQFPSSSTGKAQKPKVAPKADLGLSRKLPPFVASSSAKAKAMESAEAKRVKNALLLGQSKRNSGKR